MGRRHPRRTAPCQRPTRQHLRTRRPAFRQSRELLRMMRSFVRTLDFRPRGDRDTPHSLMLPNTSRVVAVPARDATTRGFPSVGLLILDEATRIPDFVYYDLCPTLAVSQSDPLALSTPTGERGFFFEACRETSGLGRRTPSRLRNVLAFLGTSSTRSGVGLWFLEEPGRANPSLTVGAAVRSPFALVDRRTMGPPSISVLQPRQPTAEKVGGNQEVRSLPVAARKKTQTPASAVSSSKATRRPLPLPPNQDFPHSPVCI